MVGDDVRFVRRLLLILAGFGLGFGLACLLRYDEALASLDRPRCPRCGIRHYVRPVTYMPGPNGLLYVTSGSRPLPPIQPTEPGPAWYCIRCSHGWGSRFDQPASQP
jgi:hypothetical protein